MQSSSSRLAFARDTQSLGDDELLALVLGPSDKRAQLAAHSLLARMANVADLSRARQRELAPIVGHARAARVAAAFELGRRALVATAPRPTLGQPEDIFRLLAPRMAGLAQEIFLVVGVDIRNGLVDVVEVGRGTAIGVEVHPREVFRPLLRMCAAGAIVAHNHPSGDPTPSNEDILLTRRLQGVGQLVGIPVIDHVVIGQRGYRSIAEQLGTDLDDFEMPFGDCDDPLCPPRARRA